MTLVLSQNWLLEEYELCSLMLMQISVLDISFEKWHRNWLHQNMTMFSINILRSDGFSWYVCHCVEQERILKIQRAA